MQGTCEYLAGHLWHYMFVYKLFLATPLAEVIWKFAHAIMHTATALAVAQLARTYFRGRPGNAQLIAFMLVTNTFLMRHSQDMFNDSILAIYAIFSILLMAWDRPLLASASMSMALSVKAGALLLVPSMMGWVHFFYGTKKLIQSLGVYLGLQLLLAAPFCWDPCAQLVGFKEGGTGW